MKIPVTTAARANLNHWRAGRMTRCTHPEARKPGHRYCPACRAAYMREWRQKQKEDLRRLRALAERHEPQEKRPT